MKNKEVRRSEALEREKDHKKLSTTQKIQKLDLRFGGSLGATKERARLAAQLEAENSIPKAKELKKEVKPVFVSKAEERRWENHQKQKAAKKK